MKTLVIYYSYTGKTKKLAAETAKKWSADLYEVQEVKRRSAPSAYVLGSLAARGRKTAKLQELRCDFSAYDKLIILMPIWAGYPAPPMNNIIDKLPKGKTVELIMTSGSGNSKGSAEETKQLISKKGCAVSSYRDVKTA